MSRKKTLLCLIWAFLLLLVPAVGVSAATELQYVYLTPSENGNQTGVVIALNGEKVTEASLDYGSGKVKSSKINGNHLIFLVPGADISEKNLKSVTITGTSGKETIRLSSFFQASGTKKLDPEQEIEDKGIASGRSMAAGGLSQSQEASVETCTAQNAGEIASTLAAASIQAGTSSSRSGAGSNIVVVLDPGHGGNEAGANRTWNGVLYEEKVINLKISRYTKAELEKYAGVTVYMTRTGDTTMSLEDRVDYAAGKKATVLVSQHINSTENNQDSVSGSLVFVATGNYRPDLKNESWALSNTILSELSKLGLNNLGLLVRKSENNTLYPDKSLADYYGIIRRSVLAGFPGIIVEHAFVNNPSDCKKYFSSDAAIKKLGVADATAIAKYYGLKLKTDTPDPEPDPNPNPDPTPSGTEGWKEENGHYYYQRSDGSRAASGWLKLEEGIYYLDENGYRTEGFVKVGEKTYYQEEGTGKRLTGFQTIQKKLYYFRPSTGSMLHFGWVSINGKRYYFHEDGHAQKGLATINGERYFFRTDGSMIRSKWVYYWNNWYFASCKGKIYRNTWHYIDKKRYYFNGKGITKGRKDVPSGLYTKTTVVER